MAKVIVYYVHPGHRFSRANSAMWTRAGQVPGITCVDLYADYPRFDINIDREQERLLAHDILVFQFPMFWYSTPSLLKEWQDLVLEHGFAYGAGGEALAGKAMQLAVTAAGPRDAYSKRGYQHHELREFLRPLEQTAHLCNMAFLAPYVLFSALAEDEDRHFDHHVEGYGRLLQSLQLAKSVPPDAAPDALIDHQALTGKAEA